MVENYFDPDVSPPWLIKKKKNCKIFLSFLVWIWNASDTEDINICKISALSGPCQKAEIVRKKKKENEKLILGWTTIKL